MSDSLVQFLRERSRNGDELVVKAVDGDLHFSINGKGFAGFAEQFPEDEVTEVAMSLLPERRVQVTHSRLRDASGRRLTVDMVTR